MLSLGGCPHQQNRCCCQEWKGFTPLALPELLTGGDEPIATGVIADADGVRLTGNDAVLPTDPGTTLVAGTVDVSGPGGRHGACLGRQGGAIRSNN